ncbi:hypothetical protein LV564_16575 [Komagataeibacter nataicola]|uniref:hypothetical protein n=1 Tax=Komagataeibacter nataicola TaxID=265960 RepID=UPI0011B6B8F8|nr:hypothetical protein [Komagataeibacter nataicola]WEQ55653.1 hypothetical protein LV564_16575 [Komagataeibacter nataicola]WNM09478.1 hypothetical protein RI056_05865 [Komagataeibacter nataicola]
MGSNPIARSRFPQEINWIRESRRKAAFVVSGYFFQKASSETGLGVKAVFLSCPQGQPVAVFWRWHGDG